MRRCINCDQNEDDIEGGGCVLGWHDPHRFVEVEDENENE